MPARAFQSTTRSAGGGEEPVPRETEERHWLPQGTAPGNLDIGNKVCGVDISDVRTRSLSQLVHNLDIGNKVCGVDISDVRTCSLFQLVHNLDIGTKVWK